VCCGGANQNVWSAASSQVKNEGDRLVCANVFGLHWGIKLLAEFPRLLIPQQFLLATGGIFANYSVPYCTPSRFSGWPACGP